MGRLPPLPLTSDPGGRARQDRGGLLPRLGPLCAAMFLGFLTVSLPLPALPLHVAGDLGFGTVAAGLAVGLQSIATLLTRPWSGRMVDSRGARATLLRGLILCSTAGAVYLASTGLGGAAASLAVLLVGRVTLGVGESLLITGVVSWAIQRAGPGRAGVAMSWNGMAQYGSLAAGAPLGFALYGAAGFAAVSLATVVLPLLAVAVVIGLAPTPASGGERLPLRSVILRIWRPGIALMLAGIGFAAVSTFASLDFVDRGWEGAGFCLLAYGVGFVGLRAIAGGLPDRLGGVTVAAGSMLAEAVGQALLWLAPGPSVAVLGAGLTGIGCSLVFPSLGIEALRRVSDESRGIAIGGFAAFQDLAIGITGPILGTVASSDRPATVFLFGACAALIGAMATLSLHVARRRSR